MLLTYTFEIYPPPYILSGRNATVAVLPFVSVPGDATLCCMRACTTMLTMTLNDIERRNDRRRALSLFRDIDTVGWAVQNKKHEL